MFEQEREWLERASPRTKRRLLWGILAAVIILVALAFLPRLWRGGGEATTPNEPVEEAALLENDASPAHDDPQDFITLPGLSKEGSRILSLHFQSLGGRSTLMDLKTMRLRGILRQPDQPDRRIVVMKRGGDHVRINISLENQRIALALSPEDAWEAFWRQGRLLRVEDASDQTLWNLNESVALLPELLVAWNRDWPISYLGDREFDYQLCHAFEIKPYGNQPYVVYIDPKTYRDIAIRKMTRDPDGKLVEYTYTKTDFAEAGQYVYPETMKIYRNDDFLQEILVDDLVINAGVLSTSFNRPQPL